MQRARVAQTLFWPGVFATAAVLLIFSGESTNAWPIVVLLLTGLLVASGAVREFLIMLSGRMSRVSGFGFQVDLTPLTPGNVDLIRDNVEETFRVYRSKIKRDFDQLIYLHNIPMQREQVIKNCVLPLLSEKVKLEFRSTIFVQDVLFEDVIYQLLDYYPKGRGRGRTFSRRFGILGRTWRTGQHETEGRIPAEVDDLVRYWGMTSDEAARAGQGRHSFSCVVLKETKDSPVGVLYLDAREPDAFGSSPAEHEQLYASILQGAKRYGLIASLVGVHKEMRRRGPAIRVFNPKWE